MKKIILLITILFNYNIIISQTYTSNSGLINLNLGNKYEEAEITYSDNTKVKGYINGFIENNSIEVGLGLDYFDKLEDQLNLDDKKFHFKKEINDKPIILTQDKIKSISVVVNNVTKTYYLLKIKSVDKKKNIVDLNRKVWLPLLKDSDKIKIFGFNLFINNRYVHTYTYLSNDDEYALKPTDKSFISSDAIIESYQIMLKYIFNDCDKIKPLIEEFTNKENAKKKYAELQLQIKSVKKEKDLTKDEEKNKILKDLSIEKDSFEYAGAAGGWIDALGYPFSKGRVFDVCEKDHGQYDQSGPIFWATGAAMMIRSNLFHQLNGFDDQFFAHQEEIDLCWRMQLLGFHLYACPKAKVFHVGAGTLPRGGRKVFLNFRNNLIMLTKNLPVQELIWKIPCRFALDAISAWKGLFSGDFSFFKAIVAAHFGYFSHILSGKLKRSKSPKTMKSLDGVYNGSLVWDYFIKNKQHFNKIVL